MRILWNGKILTLNPSQPHATALAIEGDSIVAAGSDDEILALANPHTMREDLAGRTVWPGLTDAHIHLQHYALSLQKVDCETDRREECLARVQQRAQLTPPGQWLLGHGWNQNTWPEGFGDAQMLDQVAPVHPVYLTAKSLHAGWANSAALRAAGITSATPDPRDGKLLRDPHGNPTGILLESAMKLVEDAIPAASPQQIRESIAAAQDNLWQMGITGVHDFDRRDCFVALQQLDQSAKLRLRVVKSIPQQLISEAVGLGLRSGFGSNYLKIGPVKCFADGALGPQTAAMLQPYENSADNTGLLMLDAEQVLEIGQQAALSGMNMAVHAIGDRANHEVLNAYAQLREFEVSHGLPPLRHRIEHVQVLHPMDFNRLAQLGVTASVQPIHATSDMLMADRFWGKRARGAYAFHTLYAAGTTLAFGSDSPVEPANPFFGLHAAVTRRRQDGSPNEAGWYPAERLPLLQALQGFTTGPAFACGREKTLGQLAPGFLADLIVLPIDPFSIPAQQIAGLKPDATMVGGEWVWKGS